jgi:threonine synthase
LFSSLVAAVFAAAIPWTIHTSDARPGLALALEDRALSSPFVRGLKCRLCSTRYPIGPTNFCTEDFGPLEVEYDYDAIGEVIDRSKIELRPFNMWRYRELLPIEGEPTVGLHTGGTPLVKADRLGAAIGLERLWVKNDAVTAPTLSFKDRVVSVALTKAKEFGLTTVGCASTGNLANSVAALAASAGLESFVFIPSDLEKAKVIGTGVYGTRVVAVRGTYDEVNRLCTQVAFKYGWGFVNINLRPFYAEGSKTVGFEIAEQLGWRTPDHLVCCMAGGSLIGKIAKAFDELNRLGLTTSNTCKFHGAQATGCNPISAAVKSGSERHRPVKKPNTIAKSLAIGDPADGYFATKLIRESGGWADDVSDDEIRDAMTLLAKTEGIFAETAGGVTLAVTRKLVEQGKIGRDDEVVICVTGNGLKTSDAIADVLERPELIGPSLEEFVKVNERETAEAFV